ncbi:MAG TPA: thioredoxin [Vicinamibacteria bacterium]|jgi:thioredoxin 2
MGDAAVRACPSCGRKNRIPVTHLADTGRCGACKAELPAVGEPIDADPAFFDEVVRSAKVPVLVDFWAEWCGPCRMAAPEVKRTAGNMAGRALVLKVDTEAHPELAARFNVRGIPNFLILKDGQVVAQRPGLVSHTQLEQWLRSAGA